MRLDTFALLAKVMAASVLAVLLLSSPAMAAFDLPAGADELLQDPLNTEFTCDEREYGYYADTKNNCQLFHICLPVKDDAGEVLSTNHWTFLCSNGTIFDQQTLSCNYATDAFPCDEAESLYGSVEFGQVEEK